jgi:hypothetical protein
MRNYLLYFADEFEADLNSSYMPDAKLLKKGIGEVLNSWSNVIIAANPATSHDETSLEEFKFFTEIRENKFEEYAVDEAVHDLSNLDASGKIVNDKDSGSNQSDMFVSVNDKNLVTTHLVGSVS